MCLMSRGRSLQMEGARGMFFVTFWVPEIDRVTVNPELDISWTTPLTMAAGREGRGGAGTGIDG